MVVDTEKSEVLRGGVVVTHKKTPSGQPIIHVKIPTICAKCKWYSVIWADRYTPVVCKVPAMTGRCWISGVRSYPSCESINKNGDCKFYEERPSWMKRLWRWRFKL